MTPEKSFQLEIREGWEASDLDLVHAWLSATYWLPGEPKDRVKKAGQNSTLVVNAFSEEKQVGYLRVISDKLTFAWIGDVYVCEESRGKGVARAMVNFALTHPQFSELVRWTLATGDAHGLYEKFGFQRVKPGVMMHLLDPDYQKKTGF